MKPSFVKIETDIPTISESKNKFYKGWLVDETDDSYILVYRDLNVNEQRFVKIRKSILIIRL